MKTTISMLIVLMLSSVSMASYLDIADEVVLIERDEIEIELRLPVVLGIDDIILSKAVNLHLHYHIIGWAMDLIKRAREDYQYYISKNPSWPWFSYVISSHYEVQLNDERYLSITQLTYEYTGGAHGNSTLGSLNVDLLEEKKLRSLNQLDISPDYRKISLAEINRQIGLNPHLYYDNEVHDFNEKAFYLTEDGVVIYYQQYEIAPYASGIPKFFISWDILRSEL